MEVIHYRTNDDNSYLNQIIMIPEKDSEINGFYKIVHFSEYFFYMKKVKSETELLNKPESKYKTYRAFVSNELEDENTQMCKKIKKSSVDKRYPTIVCSVVEYEV